MTEATRKALAKALSVDASRIRLENDEDYDYEDGSRIKLIVDPDEKELQAREDDPWGSGYSSYDYDEEDAKCIVNYKSTSCCGMAEVYNLDDIANLPKAARKPFVKAVKDAVADAGFGIAVATTIPEQRVSRRALSAGGFHIAGRSMGRHGYPVTLHRAELRPVGKKKRSKR